MKIKIKQTLIEVVIIPKKIKNIYFRVKEDLKLYVTAHPFVKEKEILKLIEENADSIYKMYQKMVKQQDYEKQFYYLGDKYDIIIDENSQEVHFNGDKIYVSSLKELNKFFNNEARRIFSQRVKQIMVQFPNIPHFSLRIRKMKSRWGVCNRGSNTITLNLDLLKKDISLLDYVIVHELCHFKHPNHSALFWQEVAKYYPNYKLARKCLKEV